MRHRLLVPTIAIALIASCAKLGPPRIEVAYADLGYDSKSESYLFHDAPFTGTAVGSHPNGTKSKYYEIRDGLFHGVVREWYENGQAQTETHFNHGKRDGKNTYWNDDGSVLSEQLWDNGKLISETKH